MNISNPALLATISADLIINGTADEIMKERKTEILYCNQIVNEMRNGYIVESKLTCPIRYLLTPPTINDLTEGIQRLKKYYHKE